MQRNTKSLIFLGSAALSAALSAGCSGGGGGGGGAASTAAATQSASATPTTSGAAGISTQVAIVPGSGAGAWFKGDLHSHSSPYSQDAHRQGGDEPGTCFHLGEVQGLDFMALTDHRTMDQVNDPTYVANLTILDGEEWGGTVHIGMVGLDHQVPEIDSTLGASTLNAQVQDAYDDAHRQGGAVIANHPCQDDKVHVWLSRDFDAIEVWNSYWNFPKGLLDASPQDVDDKVRGLGLTAIGEDANPEIRVATAIRGGGSSHQALKFWEAQLNAGRKKAIVGGGDRHSVTFPGLPTTRVFAPANTEAEIAAGIRAARTWVGADQGPELEFRADGDGDGVFEAIIGDSVPLNRSVEFQVRVRNAKDGRVDIVQNGQTLFQWTIPSDDETFTWSNTATARTWTRVDVFEQVDFSSVSQSFQILAATGPGAAGSGAQALSNFAIPLGFQVSVGTRYPTIRLPHAYDKVLNLDRMHWGFSRGAITSPIWSE